MATTSKLGRTPPTVIEVMSVLAAVLEAPQNRFGKLEFYTEAASQAREDLRQLALHFDVAKAESVPQQAAQVARAWIAFVRGDA